LRAAIFDLDGTLVDTAADLVAALNALAEEAGLARLDPVVHRSVAGAGGRALIRRAMHEAGLAPDEARVGALLPRYLALYAERVADASVPFPGAADCLRAMAAQGWRIGLCTNKPEGLARVLLDRLGMTGHFGAILGADTLPVRKPDPRHLTETVERIGGAVARAVLIGDTVTDRQTARAAGVPCILTRFGYAAEPLHALAPEGVADRLDEVPALAARLVG
jgi:phosphoglycolate phosphatase